MVAMSVSFSFVFIFCTEFYRVLPMLPTAPAGVDGSYLVLPSLLGFSLLVFFHFSLFFVISYQVRRRKAQNGRSFLITKKNTKRNCPPLLTRTTKAEEPTRESDENKEEER